MTGWRDATPFRPSLDGDRHNACVDSVTQVALIGVAGTVIAALAGMVGMVRAAGINARAQSSLEDLKSRRAVYGACTAALLVQRDAALRLMDVLDVPDGFPDLDLERARERVGRAQAVQDDVGTTVGAVMVEGPEAVADSAAEAADYLSAWLDELAWWVEQGRPDARRAVLVEARNHGCGAVDRFAAECRRALHPDDDRRPRPGLLGRLRRLRQYVRWRRDPFWRGLRRIRD